jgi:hypothetical protein
MKCLFCRTENAGKEYARGLNSDRAFAMKSLLDKVLKPSEQEIASIARCERHNTESGIDAFSGYVRAFLHERSSDVVTVYRRKA